MLITNRLQYLLGSGGLEEKLKKITDGVVEIFNADFCRIWIKGPGDLCEKGCIHARAKDPEKVCRLREYCLHLTAGSGRYTHIDGPHSRMPFGLYKVGSLAAGQVNKFLTNDAVNDPQIMDHEWARGLGLVSFAGYKLQDTTGETIGVLALFSRQPITAEEDALLESLAGTAAQVIQSGKAEEALRIKTDQFAAVANAMTSFLDSGDWAKASSIILRCVLKLTESEYGFIGILTEEGKLRILCYEGVTWDKVINREFYEKALRTYEEVGYLEFTNFQTLFGAVITSREAVISNDPAGDPRSGKNLPPGHPPLRHFLGVPILRRYSVVGIIGVANRPGGYSRTDQSRIEILCQAAGVLYDSYLRHNREITLETEYKHAEEQIRHLAYYDLLTDLPNRLMFHISTDKAITAAKRDNTTFGLLLIDLNHFKEINDTLGHNNGDLILRQIGIRFQNILNKSDFIAYMGGDEYAVLLPKADAGTAVKTAQGIINKLEEPFLVENIPINVNASIGIVFFPGHGDDHYALMRHADIAMHAAKKGDSGLCIYSAGLNQYTTERLRLTGDLRYAIERGQFFLVYQPKIDLKTRRTKGVEALIRWQHPKLGVIQPDKFIKLAEQTGLIKQITLLVLKEALRQSKSWHRAGLDFNLAINLSARSLQAPQLVDQIKGSLSTWGIAPDKLRFEITESVIMADPELALDIISQLTAMGLRFTIDDFGTGYSSLGYLQRLPVDEIKIDRSFVVNMLVDKNSMKIVRSIIELAHNLGLRVTAEGVENQELLDTLSSLNCDAAQGYFISPPISQEEIAGWLRK